MKARKGIIKKIITKNGNSQNILDNSFGKKQVKSMANVKIDVKPVFISEGLFGFHSYVRKGKRE